MTKIIIRTKAELILNKEYEGETTVYIQSIQKTEKKGFEVLKIKLSDSILNFKEGDLVSVPVKLSAMNSQIFYAQDGKIEVIKGTWYDRLYV